MMPSEFHTVRFQLRARPSFLAVVVLALVAAWFAACNQTLDPRASLDQQMVVYTVLSTDRTAQFIRVNSTYMPAGYDANAYTEDSWISDASVRLTGAGRTWIFHDTSVARPDTNRYKIPIRMYAVNPFVPERGKQYDLLVESVSLGTASASVIVPAKPAIALNPAAVFTLNQPLSAAPTALVQYTIDLGSTAGGYTSHLYVYYDVLKGQRWVEERFEVPLEPTNKDTTYSLDRPIYDPLNASSISKRTTIQFRAGYLITIIKKLTKVDYKDTHLIYKWIVLTVLQTDKNLFGYYKSVRGYQDPLSIRLDQPLYSKIDGGVGMVGAYSLDSLTFVLPEVFGGNR